MCQCAISVPNWFWHTKRVDNQQVKGSVPVCHQKGIEEHFKTDKKHQNAEVTTKEYKL